MHVGIHADEITSEEEVDLNYDQNYVRVSTPGIRGTSPGVMIHDYNMVIKFSNNHTIRFAGIE